MANRPVDGSGGASKKIVLSPAVQKQISQDAQGTLVGGPKAVRSITWMAGADILEQIGNYIKSCYDDDYAQGVRDEFFKQMQELVKSNFNGTERSPNPQPMTLENLIKDIKSISDEDLPESEKNVLITQAYEAVKEAAKKNIGADSKKLDNMIQNIEKMPIQVLSETKKNELIIELYDTVQNLQEPVEAELFAKDGDTDQEAVDAMTFLAENNIEEVQSNIDDSISGKKYQEAKKYFKDEKAKIQSDLLKMDEIANMPNLLVNKEIMSEKDLKDFVKAVIEEKVKNCKNNEGHIDIDKLKHLEKEIGQFIDRETAVPFSPGEKKELMMLARCAWKKEETMQGVAEMLKVALKKGSADKAIQDIRSKEGLMDRQFTTDEGLIKFQKECIQAGINAMMEASHGSEENLSSVERNVRELLDKGMPTALSAKEKEKLIETVIIAKK